MDAIQLLESQHRQIEDLLSRCEQALGAAKQVLFEQIADALAIHTTIEEQHFYPALRAEGTADLIEECLDEHLDLKRDLVELIEMSVEDEEFGDRLENLKETFLHHVKDLEEPRLFALANKVLVAELLVALADQMTETITTLESEGAPRNTILEDLQESAPL
jgi:hypothetical protein